MFENALEKASKWTISLVECKQVITAVLIRVVESGDRSLSYLHGQTRQVGKNKILFIVVLSNCSMIESVLYKVSLSPDPSDCIQICVF